MQPCVSNNTHIASVGVVTHKGALLLTVMCTPAGTAVPILIEFASLSDYLFLMFPLFINLPSSLFIEYMG